MQREIKCRAWDKKSKVMVDLMGFKYVGALHIQLFYHDEDGCNTTCTVLRENVEILQCTGLHDKNGKEIYEGDAVRGEDGELFTVKYGEHNTSEWNDTYELGFYVESNSEEEISRAIRTDIIFWAKYRGLEVVGDIYTTPELLEVSE